MKLAFDAMSISNCSNCFGLNSLSNLVVFFAGLCQFQAFILNTCPLFLVVGYDSLSKSWSVLWTLAKWGWVNAPFLSQYLLIFFPCIYVPNHTPIWLMQFVSFHFTELDCWFNHWMTLWLLCSCCPFDEAIHHQNWSIHCCN